MPVATKTQSVTNSKLALGTAALLMASGLAFIVIPAANRSGIASSKEIADKRLEPRLVELLLRREE